MKFILSLLVFIILIQSSHAETSKIVLATFDQKAPRLTASEMIIRELYGKLNIELEIVKHPGNRVLTLANSGKVDGVLVRATIIEGLAENLVRIPYPIAQIKYAVYAKKRKSIKVTDWRSLAPYKVGIGRGIKLVEERTKHLDRIIINSYNSLFKMLYLERVDVVIFTELDGLFALKAMDLHYEIEKLDPVMEVSPSYHFLHKKHGPLIDQLTQLMTQMESTGELQALILRSERVVADSLP